MSGDKFYRKRGLELRRIKKGDRIKDMLENVVTKDTYITRATIRNRFIELA